MGCSQNYITLSKIIAGGEFDDENEQEQGDVDVRRKSVSTRGNRIFVLWVY